MQLIYTMTVHGKNYELSSYFYLAILYNYVPQIHFIKYY